MTTEDALSRAAESVRRAEAFLIGAGAGMGVDSGLPDFRGDEGFWNAYPPYRHLDVGFMDMANPHWFARDPRFAWGFYGHRRNLYRETEPHAGFSILKRWADASPGGGFVFTSNVDNAFQKAGFGVEQVNECHGAIEWNQCFDRCGAGIFPGGPEQIEIDMESMRAEEPLPACPECGGLARPNILMFGDFGWDPGRDAEQTRQLQRWVESVSDRPLVLIEVGAGRAVPTVRSFCERLTRAHPDAVLVRINPREPEVPTGHVGLAQGALDTLRRLDELVS